MSKQMDRFGLNPSHGISSPWPSSSNLHVFTEEKWQNGGIYVWLGGGELNVLLLVPSRESKMTLSKRPLCCVLQ